MLNPNHQLFFYEVCLMNMVLIIVELEFSLYYFVIRYCLMMIYYDVIGEILRKGVTVFDEGYVFLSWLSYV